MRSFATRLTAVFVLLACGLFGCGDDNNNPSGNNNGGGGSTTVIVFVGTVNGDNGSLSGSITINIDGTTVTGSFKVVTPAAATHALTGTYDPGSKVLGATGGGYNFGGGYDGVDRLEGLMTGTGSGTFVAVKDESSAAVAFCGTFAGDDDGVWNFTIDGTTVTGSYTTSGGTLGALDGTISGNTITINNPGGGTPLATGTRSGDNASGTWNNGLGGTGTWTGSKCN